MCARLVCTLQPGNCIAGAPAELVGVCNWISIVQLDDRGGQCIRCTQENDLRRLTQLSGLLWMQVLKQKRLYENQREQLYSQQYNVDQTSFMMESVQVRRVNPRHCTVQGCCAMGPRQILAASPYLWRFRTTSARARHRVRGWLALSLTVAPANWRRGL